MHHLSGPDMTPHGYYDQPGYEPSPSSTGSAGMHYKLWFPMPYSVYVNVHDLLTTHFFMGTQYYLPPSNPYTIHF